MRYRPVMAAELTVTEVDANTLTLMGEVDTHTAPQLEHRLASVVDGTSLVLDLGGVSFISSAGLSVILNAQRRLEASGGSLSLRSVSATVTRLVELSGLSSTLEIS